MLLNISSKLAKRVSKIAKSIIKNIKAINRFLAKLKGDNSKGLFNQINAKLLVLYQGELIKQMYSTSLWKDGFHFRQLCTAYNFLYISI